jgi:hypothetical protein
MMSSNLAVKMSIARHKDREHLEIRPRPGKDPWQ